MECTHVLRAKLQQARRDFEACLQQRNELKISLKSALEDKQESFSKYIMEMFKNDDLEKDLKKVKREKSILQNELKNSKITSLILLILLIVMLFQSLLGRYYGR